MHSPVIQWRGYLLPVVQQCNSGEHFRQTPLTNDPCWQPHSVKDLFEKRLILHLFGVFTHNAC